MSQRNHSRRAIVRAISGAFAIGATIGASHAAITVEAESMSRANYSLDGAYIKVTEGATSGTATKSFSGASGTYDIVVHVRAENDGRPTLDVYRNSSLLKTFTYPSTSSSQTSASFTLSGVALNAGDTMKLVGRINGGALARVDKVVYTQVAAAPAPTEPVVETGTSPITVEAESMSRSNYSLDGGLIKLSTSTSGSATSTFNGPAGTYRMQVYVQPENDGQSTLEVFKGSTSLARYTYPLSTAAASFTIDNVTLAAGESVRLVGTANAGALARVDKIVYTPIATSTPTPSPEPVPTTPSTATTVTLEAEGMTRTNYALDGKLIKLSANSGNATAKFGGVTGTYRMQVYVQPESDGQSTLEVFRGTTSLKRYTYPLSTSATSFTVDSVTMTNGDTVRLAGAIGGGALARVDKVVFTPLTATSPAPTPTEPAPTEPTPTDPAAPSLPTAGKAVPTFESLGLYWTPGTNPGAAGCTVRYRKSGDTAWKDGLAMWYDSRNSECRGSIVHLAAGTEYDLQFGLPGKSPSAQLKARTWAEQFPVAKIVTVTNRSSVLNITEGGTPNGYVLYTGAAGTTIDGGDSQTNNITVSAPYVIIRGLTLKGAKQDAIKLLSGAHDVVIEDNDISNWGRYRTTGSNGVKFGMDLDAAVRCSQLSSLERVVIQRNRIHHPRYSANSWSFGHPEGPQGVTFESCGGNHVIRHNEIYSDASRYFNDGMGGGSNFSDKGFPNYDSDIYGNLIRNTWDDAIEAEGGNRNVRIWGNYFDQTALAVATTVAHHGPVYVFRNVYNRSRMRSESAPDADDRNAFAKSGTGRGYGNGRRYVFHNTLLQAPPVAGATLTSGAGVGLVGPSSTEILTNTVSRNNIWHIWKPHWASIDEQGGSGNDVDYDLFNGQIRTSRGTQPNGIVGTPIYQSGHGWSSESNGLYQLAPTSPGYDKGQRLANFNEGYTGNAPDIGAHEAGSPAMKFGLKAGTRAY
jgi:hypothetical protein